MLTPAAAAELADVYGFGGGDLEGPVARGQMGQVWSLRTPGGRYAVKEWFADPDVARLAEQARFTRRAAALGVCTPAIHDGLDGKDVQTVADGAPVRVFDWVDLLPPTRELDPVDVGRLVATLHRAGEPVPGPVDNWFTTGVPEASWEDLLPRLEEAGAPFVDELAAFVPELLAASARFEAPQHLRMCHRDLWCDNVLASTDGRLCVIDFDNAGPADPSHELAMVLYEFGLDDADRTRALADAYAAAGGPGRVDRFGHFTMVVAEDGHMAQLAASRWLGARDEREREQIERWFAEIVDDPETPARLERILDALA